jgi:hypothetical protein
MEHPQHLMISNVAFCMREFQKTNCIKYQCITNVQYLYDCAKINTALKIKAKAFIVVSLNDKTNTLTCVGGHLVVVSLNDNNTESIIDPSYDVFSLKNKLYFDNIKKLMDQYTDISKEAFKQSISDFLYFIKLAERINNGELVICDKQFYDSQADYIEDLFNKKV